MQGVVLRSGHQRSFVDQELQSQHGRTFLVFNVYIHAQSTQTVFFFFFFRGIRLIKENTQIYIDCEPRPQS